MTGSVVISVAGVTSLWIGGYDAQRLTRADPATAGTPGAMRPGDSALSRLRKTSSCSLRFCGAEATDRDWANEHEAARGWTNTVRTSRSQAPALCGDEFGRLFAKHGPHTAVAVSCRWVGHRTSKRDHINDRPDRVTVILAVVSFPARGRSTSRAVAPTPPRLRRNMEGGPCRRFPWRRRAVRPGSCGHGSARLARPLRAAIHADG